MCGICGYVSKEEITLAQLTEMNNTMYHRGPDDGGVEIYSMQDGYEVGLAQRRLSILDLSPLGHQPMHSYDKRLSVVYNGEIYNFQELREELKDYPFRSHCDTEVLLAAYHAWGIEGVSRLNGMFAAAIYDREEQSLYLIRDRIGKKPLYYWLHEGNLVFASELKPIMKAPGFSQKINQKILGRYLYQQYIKAPDSIFEDVYQVEPGGIVKFCKGKTEKKKYWDLTEIYHQKKGTGPKDYEEAKQELTAVLKKSVSQRMISDVPLGTFLSGGYDSSLVTALAQSVSTQPVKTFSIGFHEKKYNEAVYAGEVAKYLGTNHTQLYVEETDMLRMIESLPKFYDEPFADSSQIPTMLVSELAKRDVTVVLSGDGGDELFCGYHLYQKVRQAQQLDFFGGIAHAVGRIGGLEEHYPFPVRVISKNRNQQAKTQFIAGNYLKAAQQIAGKDGQCCFYDFEEKYGESNWQERRMLLDMETYLPGDILCKVDRAGMKYSLETRCPILDKEVLEFSFGIPHAFKYQSGIKKRILKDITHEYLPQELMERPKKGFSVPLDKWLRGSLKEQLLDYTEVGYLKRQNLFLAENTSKFVRDYLAAGDGGSGSGENYSRIIWALFVFQQWYRYYE